MMPSFPPPPLIIRADAGPTIGTGHVMRMLALAQAHRRRGGEAIFITTTCPPTLNERLQREGFSHHEIKTLEPGDQQDLKQTLEICAQHQNPWLILDGYHFTEDYQKGCQQAGLALTSVDDFGHCAQWHSDFLLNQNLGSEKNPASQAGLVELLGTRYALLREEFLSVARKSSFATPIKNLIITMGGSDPINATNWIIQELDKLDTHHLNVRVIIGGANPHQDKLKTLTPSFPVTWKVDVADMPAEYSWADGVISAGGSSCWEWLSCGLPGAVVTIAENQEAISTELHLQKLALTLGYPGEKSITETLQQWLAQPSQIIDEAEVNSAIDGRGADRVMAALDGSDCLIKEVDPAQDTRFIFDLANSESVRSAGFDTEPLVWENHCAWLQKHCQSPASHLYLIENGAGKSAGALRFQQRNDRPEWEISISLTEKARGKGYADHAIQIGIKELSLRFALKHFLATIRSSNLPSIKLFKRLGFQQESTNEDREIWVHALS